MPVNHIDHCPASISLISLAIEQNRVIGPAVKKVLETSTGMMVPSFLTWVEITRDILVPAR